MSANVIQNKISGLNMSLDRKTEYIYSLFGILKKFSFIHLCPNRENKSYNIGELIAKDSELIAKTFDLFKGKTF
jgi:hypothetical protein